MSGYKEKITVIILVTFLLLIEDINAQTSGLSFGVGYGIDFQDKYVDNAIVDRYVKHESRLNLNIGYLLKFEKISINASLNPFVSFARINPHITSNLDPGPQNRKDYFGIKTDIMTYLGDKRLKPTIGVSMGILPEYPYEIKNYLKNSTEAYEWGLLGGLTLFHHKRSFTSLGYYYGSVITGMGDVYDVVYGIWQIDYRFYLKNK